MNFNCKHSQLRTDVAGVHSDNLIIRNDQEDGDILFYVNDGGTDTKVATFDGATGEITFHKDFNLAEDLEVLDGKKVILGTGLDGEIYSSSDNLYIRNVTEDKDIIISVNDGSSQTTVCTFNADVPAIDIPDGVAFRLGTGLDFQISHSSDDIILQNATQDKDLIFKCNDGGSTQIMLTMNGDVPALDVPDEVKLRIGDGQDLEIYVSSDDAVIANATQDKDIIFKINDGGTPATILTLDADVPQINFNAQLISTATLTQVMDLSGATITNLIKLADGEGCTVGAMPAKSPEDDAEAGYLLIDVGGTVYHIPFYASA